MKALFDAIYDKFIVDGKYGLTALYNTEADDEAVYPYGTFSLVGNRTDMTGDFSVDDEDCLVQFNLFDDDPKSTDINAAYKLLKAAFDKFDLVVAGYETISLVKEVANLIRVEKRWQYNISFRIQIQSSEIVRALTYGLPKTGQVIEYEAGDDGTYEAGWWRGRLNADNRIRYIAETIGGDDIVFDLATGLMWAADGNESGCNNGAIATWSDAIIYTEALSFAGFSDWRLPNVKELLSLVEYDADLYVASEPLIQEPPFSNTSRATYNTSTTTPGSTANRMIVNFNTGEIQHTAKTNMRRLRACRRI